MRLLTELFFTFAKIGLFTFGGGYAMIPIIEHTCVEGKKWITHEDMMNITVVAESTPGPIAINCATFVGYRQKGIRGAAAATLGVVLPSLIIICLIAMLLDNLLEITWIANAFRGIKLAVGLLIANAAIGMIRKMPKKPLPYAILLSCTAAVLAGNVLDVHLSSVGLMLAGGLVSLLYGIARNRRSRGGKAA